MGREMETELVKGLREIEEEEETIVALVVFKEDKQCCHLSVCVFMESGGGPHSLFQLSHMDAK